MRQRADKSATIKDFTDLLHMLFQAAWGNDWGKFTGAFPSGTEATDIDLPVITYRRFSKEPGIVGNRDTREIKPRFRQTLDVEENENLEDQPHKMNVYAQVFDYIIEFKVFESTNEKVDELADKFEAFIRTYTGYMKKQGVLEILFKTMESEEEPNLFNDTVMVRKFHYLVRIEEQTVVPSGIIADVIGRVEAMKALANDTIDEQSIKFNN